MTQILPESVVPVVTDGSIFPNIHSGAGSSGVKNIEGWGVADATTVTGDVTFECVFPVPPTLPTGTLKLQIDSFANATSGVLKVNPKWFALSAGEDPSSQTLSAEGTTTITWSTGDNDDWIQTKITLDAATTPVGGDKIIMDLVFEDTSMTLAVTSTHLFSIIWE